MLRLYNTLTKKTEEFVAISSGQVGMYACGPTVYDFPTIGNWRKFVFDDILRRVLEYNGYKVLIIMNATDVGHLSGDNLGDADFGEDRLEKGAKRENKTVWQVAQEYLDDFVNTRSWLNILSPTQFVRATEHINEQIELIKRLKDQGLAYETSTGIFFDVGKYPDYGKLGGQKLSDKKTGAREEVEIDPSKHDPADFALWFKRVGRFADHQMFWGSPWGNGFPGWHIECSAMAMKYLGESFDIHTGGVDHISIHHANEIAQSEGATGQPFAKFWMHSEFLTIDGGRMGKSLGNAYNLHDIQKRGINPLALRYFYLSAHYRTKLNFTWETLESAENSLARLQNKIGLLQQHSQDKFLGEEFGCAEYEQEFLEAINNDLNMPKALAVVWKLIEDKSLNEQMVLVSLLRMDKVLGLGFEKNLNLIEEIEAVPTEINELLAKREIFRKESKFADADMVRSQIEEQGFILKDKNDGTTIVSKSKPNFE